MSAARKCGFTLIELLLVIALLGLIIGIETKMIGGFWTKKEETKYYSELAKFASLCQMLSQRAPDCDLPDGNQNLSDVDCLQSDLNFQIWNPEYECETFEDGRCMEAYAYIRFSNTDDDFSLKLRAARKAFRRTVHSGLFLTDGINRVSNDKDYCLDNDCIQVYFGCKIY